MHSIQPARSACEWCAVFSEHLQELMQAALMLSGTEARVEGVVLEALDAAIEQREIAPAQAAARRFVMRAALEDAWRAYRPQEAVLAAA